MSNTSRTPAGHENVKLRLACRNRALKRARLWLIEHHNDEFVELCGDLPYREAVVLAAARVRTDYPEEWRRIYEEQTAHIPRLPLGRPTGKG